MYANDRREFLIIFNMQIIAIIIVIKYLIFSKIPPPAPMLVMLILEWLCDFEKYFFANFSDIVIMVHIAIMPKPRYTMFGELRVVKNPLISSVLVSLIKRMMTGLIREA